MGFGSIAAPLARLVLPLLAIGSAAAGPFNPDTDWMRTAGLGYMMHWWPTTPAEMAQVAEFDAAGLAGQLQQAGARYFMISLGQNAGFYDSPNATYDSIVGYGPGERTSVRDLPMDLSRALEPKGIRLMLYLPASPPNDDARALTRFGLAPNVNDGPLDTVFAKKWARVIREWSDRYGDRVSGWWIDGCYARRFANAAVRERTLALYDAAIKHGNPRAIAAYNPGLVKSLSRSSDPEDFTAGEMREPLDYLPPSRWIGGSQAHILSFLGTGWSVNALRYADARWIDCLTREMAAGGAVTLDVHGARPGEPGTMGIIAQPTWGQMLAIGKAFPYPAPAPIRRPDRKTSRPGTGARDGLGRRARSGLGLSSDPPGSEGRGSTRRF